MSPPTETTFSTSSSPVKGRSLLPSVGTMLGIPVYELLGGCVRDRRLGYAGCAGNYPWSELEWKVNIYREAAFLAMKVAAG